MAQDRKYKYENGKFVNRISGEAIPDDEPVIIFRARDIRSVPTLLTYRDMCLDEHHKQAVQDRIDDFMEFQRTHPDQLKEPGVTRDMRLNSDA